MSKLTNTRKITVPKKPVLKRQNDHYWEPDKNTDDETVAILAEIDIALQEYQMPSLTTVDKAVMSQEVCTAFAKGFCRNGCTCPYAHPSPSQSFMSTEVVVPWRN